VSASSPPVRGVLDTSTVIRLGRLSDPALLPAEPLITAITLAELSVGPLVAGDERERAARQAHLQQAEADFDALPFDAAAARAFGQVAASLRRAERKTATRAYDAMTAATALSNDLPVYTCNPADYAGIDDLQVVTMPEPGGPSRRDNSRRAREGGEWRFPAWQFDPAGSDGLVPGFSDALRALQIPSELARIAWFVSKSASLGGVTRLDSLKAGAIDEVLAEARAASPA